MQVSQINNTNFSSKQRFLDESALTNFKNIRKKIGNGSVIHSDNVFWHKRLGYLRTGNVFFSNVKPALVVLGNSKIEINDDGSVKILEKPLLKTKSGLMNKLGEYLAIFDNMFNKPKVVEKNYLFDTGYVDESDGKAYITKREWLRSN